MIDNLEAHRQEKNEEMELLRRPSGWDGWVEEK